MKEKKKYNWISAWILYFSLLSNCLSKALQKVKENKDKKKLEVMSNKINETWELAEAFKVKKKKPS